MIYQVAVFYVAALIANCAFATTAAEVGTRLGARLLGVKIGLLRVFRRGRLSIGALPLTASVSFASIHDGEWDPEDVTLLENHSRLARFAISFSGGAGLLLLAVSLRGARGWHSCLNGFEQILSGALAPTSRGVELVHGYWLLSISEGPLAAIGVLVSKFAAFNLLPIPLFAGGASLIQLLWPTQRGPSERSWLRLQQIGLCLLVPLWLSWLIAIYFATRL